MEKFLLEKQKELESKLLEHRKILEEQEEYEKLLKFCEDYLGWKDGELNSKGKKVSTMTALSPLVFTEAEVMKEGPIAIRLTDDLFAEMTVPRAMEFSQKKLKLLKVLESRARSECHYLQAQLNILLLGWEKLVLTGQQQ